MTHSTQTPLSPAHKCIKPKTSTPSFPKHTPTLALVGARRWCHQKRTDKGVRWVWIHSLWAILCTQCLSHFEVFSEFLLNNHSLGVIHNIITHRVWCWWFLNVSTVCSHIQDAWHYSCCNWQAHSSRTTMCLVVLAFIAQSLLLGGSAWKRWCPGWQRNYK